jgi:hypothetical protein
MTAPNNRVAAFSRLEGRAAAGIEDARPRRFRAPAFLPGEAFQFDWSEDWAIIGGERTKLQVAHFKRGTAERRDPWL